MFKKSLGRGVYIQAKGEKQVLSYLESYHQYDWWECTSRSSGVSMPVSSGPPAKHSTLGVGENREGSWGCVREERRWGGKTEKAAKAAKNCILSWGKMKNFRDSTHMNSSKSLDDSSHSLRTWITLLSSRIKKAPDHSSDTKVMPVNNVSRNCLYI